MPGSRSHEDLGRKHELHGVQPVLPVRDVAASAAYYVDVLGFDLDFLHGDPPMHGRIKKGDGTFGQPIYIHLTRVEAGDEVRPSGELRLHVGRDLDALFAAYRARGVAVVAEPISQPWGLREFIVRDRDGHALRFCAEAEGATGHSHAAHVKCPPDLSSRPFQLTVERAMSAPPATLVLAFTHQFDRWFAAPGSLLTQGEVNTPFFFETVHQPDATKPVQRHPHYGRFLRIEPERLIELTWVTKGTKGAETVVTVELTPQGAGTRLRLTHAGFPDAESRDGHEQAWPSVLAHLDASLAREIERPNP
jgi:uncharacterized protein YndB with AHSA1/START domain/uncharacterized glyoxalase superfamily protein PhnB